jgi:hypothetical protein
VNADKRAQRIEDLKKKSFGQIHAFSINDPRKSLPFSNFLRSNGFIVIEDGLDLIIGSRRLGVFLSPDIYLNDRQLFHFSELATFSLNAVDYIEIDKTKINPGLYGQSSFGTIKIYTDQRLAAVPENFRSFFNEVEIPLAFSRPKRFYNPKYIDYNNLSYQEIGAIDWHANLKVDSSNNIVFKIPDFNQDEIKVFIEGIINDNQLVSKTFYSKL